MPIRWRGPRHHAHLHRPITSGATLMELSSLLRPGLWRRVSVRLLGVTLVALMVPFLVGVALLMNAERTRIENDRLQRAGWLERHYRAEAARLDELPEPQRTTRQQLQEARIQRDLAAVKAAAEQQAIDSTREIQIGAGLTFLSMVVFVVAAVRFAHRRILLDRLGALVQVGQHVAGGDYSHRCDVGGHDELTVVADSINGMLDTIERSHSELEARVDFRTNQLREAVDNAERAAAAKGEFLAVVSHEIRTPMNAVLGASELLLETPMNDEHRELLQTVRKSGGMLLDLINDVLDYSKIEAGRIEIESTPFDLEVELETVVRVFEEAARTRGLELSMDMDPTIERMVIGDPMRVRQVAMNLISNALKFTSKGGVTLTVRKEPGDVPMVRCSVTDTGIGIRDVDQKRLFEAFVQADVSTTRKYGGTGLGLAICRKLVERMGGAIGVQSTAGVGSTFTFTLKLRPVSDDQRAALATSAGLKGRSILVVGDDGARIEEIGRVLQDYQAEVHWSTTSSTLAATFGSASRPEVVVLASQQEEGTDALGALFGEA
ncbi:MAG: ATP-binding protein, partial [Planctomycetota bacterium]